MYSNLKWVCPNTFICHILRCSLLWHWLCIWSYYISVRQRGLEPPRDCSHQPLKLARLPFRHCRKISGLSRWSPFRLFNFLCRGHGGTCPIVRKTLLLHPKDGAGLEPTNLSCFDFQSKMLNHWDNCCMFSLCSGDERTRTVVPSSKQNAFYTLSSISNTHQESNWTNFLISWIRFVTTLFKLHLHMEE